jgi:hypothetical protein
MFQKMKLISLYTDNRRGPVAARLLRFWVRMDVCLVWVLSGTDLWVGLITRPEESYWMCGVYECDREASTLRRPWPTTGCRARKKYIYTDNRSTILQLTEKGKEHKQTCILFRLSITKVTLCWTHHSGMASPEAVDVGETSCRRGGYLQTCWITIRNSFQGSLLYRGWVCEKFI